MIKAIFFDIDGTLLPKGAPILPHDTTEALLALKEKGILIFIATGRPYQAVEKLPLGHIPFDGYMTLTGQVCMDSSGNIIHCVSFSEEDTEILHKAFESGECLMALIDQYGAQYNTITTKEERLAVTTKPEYRRTERAYQLSAFLEKGKEGSFRDRLPKNCIITRWSDAGFDVIPPTGGKAAGIEFYSRHYDIDISETMAFGDAENDVDMLKKAGIGIAMGNAGEELKKVADYVTSDCDKGGIINALKHYKIL